VKPDLCSYSAYSSFNGGYDFEADLAEIRTSCGAAPLILGELGFKSNGRNGQALSALYGNALAAAGRADVRAVFFWQAFEGGSEKRYGLFDGFGAPLQWRWIKDRVTP
jgi:hypothetical protein